MTGTEDNLAAFRALAAQPDAELCLLDGVLLIGAALQPQMDAAGCREALEGMAAELRPSLADSGDLADQARTLADYLHDVRGFSGNAVEYYDPRNSFLNEVLERRTGIPITLALVYLEVGRRLGLPMAGVGFPGHFLVKLEGDPDVVIDPFSGELLDEAELEQRYRIAAGAGPTLPREALRAATSREILFRMLTNLKRIYLEQKILPEALICCDRAIALMPQVPQEYRDRALVYYGLQRSPEALADLQHFLDLAPEDPTAGPARELAEQLEAQVGRPV
jgi:regulator of sirC expression with transglutaminase-like and TPR domain